MVPQDMIGRLADWASAQPVWAQVAIGLTVFLVGAVALVAVVSWLLRAWDLAVDALDRTRRPGFLSANWPLLLLILLLPVVLYFTATAR